MKAVYGVVLLLSIVFCVFSVVYGVKASSVRSTYGYGSGDFDQFERDRSEVHDVVRLVSVMFYVVCLGVFAAGAAMASGRIGWRIATGIAVLVAVGMAGWSCILSGAVSFDEVFVAWIVASIFFAIMAGIGTLSKGRPKGGDLR